MSEKFSKTQKITLLRLEVNRTYMYTLPNPQLYPPYDHATSMENNKTCALFFYDRSITLTK